MTVPAAPASTLSRIALCDGIRLVMSEKIPLRATILSLRYFTGPQSDSQLAIRRSPCAEGGAVHNLVNILCRLNCTLDIPRNSAPKQHPQPLSTPPHHPP